MAITTLDGALAGVQPVRYWAKNTLAITRPQTLWPQIGIPGAGGYNGTLNGANHTAPVNGQLPHTNAAGGQIAYINRATFAHCTGTSGGWAMLCDRLWSNGNIDVTITTQQNITQPTLPSRDAVGSGGGTGVLIAVEVSGTVVGAATPTFTVGYTNSAGTTSRSGSNINATVAAPAAGSAFLIGLQAGDVGVGSVTSITLSAAWTSGTINLVAFRPLMLLASNAVSAAGDCITGGFTRLYDGTVPYWMCQQSVAPATVFGTYVESQG